MFGTAKPLASLSSTLLARKGQARPAMRPQGFAGYTQPVPSLEDLGWNDMGPDVPPASGDPERDEADGVEPALPPVLVEREALAEELNAPVAEAAPAPAASVDRPVVPADVLPADVLPVPTVAALPAAVAVANLRQEAAAQARIAFTLRLDAERHLKLRMASAVAHRSAQQIVQHALDQFLAGVPQADALIAQLPAPPSKRQRSRS